LECLGSPYPVLMKNKNKEVEEAMSLLMRTQKEREEIEQQREELLRRIQDEKEKTDLYKDAIVQLKESLKEEKKSKEQIEEGTLILSFLPLVHPPHNKTNPTNRKESSSDEAGSPQREGQEEKETPAKESRETQPRDQ